MEIRLTNETLWVCLKAPNIPFPSLQCVLLSGKLMLFAVLTVEEKRGGNVSLPGTVEVFGRFDLAVIRRSSCH